MRSNHTGLEFKFSIISAFLTNLDNILTSLKISQLKFTLNFLLFFRTNTQHLRGQ